MSIETDESLMADMHQSPATHADNERTYGNPARRAVVLVGHGGVPRDYPRERLTQLRGLGAVLGQLLVGARQLGRARRDEVVQVSVQIFPCVRSGAKEPQP